MQNENVVYVKVPMFPLIDITDGDNEYGEIRIVWVEYTEVEQITTGKKGISVFQISGRKYKPAASIDGLEEALIEYGFMRTDNGTIANLNRAKYFDKDMRVLFFDSNVDNFSEAATVAKIRSELLESHMKDLNIEYVDRKASKAKESKKEKVGIINSNPAWSY